MKSNYTAKRFHVSLPRDERTVEETEEIDLGEHIEPVKLSPENQVAFNNFMAKIRKETEDSKRGQCAPSDRKECA